MNRLHHSTIVRCPQNISQPKNVNKGKARVKMISPDEIFKHFVYRMSLKGLIAYRFVEKYTSKATVKEKDFNRLGELANKGADPMDLIGWNSLAKEISEVRGWASLRESEKKGTEIFILKLKYFKHTYYGVVGMMQSKYSTFLKRRECRDALKHDLYNYLEKDLYSKDLEKLIVPFMYMEFFRQKKEYQVAIIFIFLREFGFTETYKLFIKTFYDEKLDAALGDAIVFSDPFRLKKNCGFQEALYGNDLLTIKTILESKSPYAESLKSLDSFWALHLAVEKENLEAVKLLLKFGFDVNRKNYYKQTPLHVACKSGNEEAVKVLLEAGADINAKAPFEKRFSSLEEDFFWETPLEFALKANSYGVLEVLVKHALEVESCKESIISIAVLRDCIAYSSVKCLMLLLKHMDPEEMKKSLDYLLNRTAYARVEMRRKIQSLVFLGARVKLLPGEEKGTALHSMVCTGFSNEGIYELLKLGADINAKDKDGWTPLHWAVSFGKPSKVKLLLSLGADPMIEDERGRNCIDLAEEEKESPVLREYIEKSRQGVIELLKDAAAELKE